MTEPPQTPAPAPAPSGALPPPRRAPDVEAAREALERALLLLDAPTDPHMLAMARAVAQAAAEAIPYRWEQPRCAEFRRNSGLDTCRAATCTRCAAYRAGDAPPLTGW
ncbi:hypothetical protein ACIRLA_36315 [Streptomyces sp. NPDC102364]|uniref:hypothetical protein n=1 Tax=Streptomyces sp. NPDC102364 TaxID=3366161 RepID=UPI00381B6003